MRQISLFPKTILFRIGMIFVFTGLLFSGDRNSYRFSQIYAQTETKNQNQNENQTQNSEKNPEINDNKNDKNENSTAKNNKNETSESKSHDFLQELKNFADEAREKTLNNRKIVSDFQDFEDEIGIFRASLGSSMMSWEKYLNLSQLEKTIKSESPDLALIDFVLEKLQPHRQNMQRPVFVRFREALEKQRELLVSPPKKQNQDSDEEITKFFDELPKLIEHHLQSPDKASSEAVAEAMNYLQSHCNAKNLLARLRKEFLKPNLLVYVNSSILPPIFQREIDEPITVNDNILGTFVRGNGRMTGNVDAKFIENEQSAIIRVVMNGLVETKTTGSNGPVLLRSSNSSVTKTTKEIIISQDAITTTPAKTSAKLKSHIDNVNYTRDGLLVRAFAPNQIQSRKPAADAESERLTERRMNKRVDQAVDERVGKINARLKNYEKNAGGSPLRMVVETISTTENKLNFRGAIVGLNQLTTSADIPPLESDAAEKADVFIQLHESLANNAGTSGLSGKKFAEEKIVDELKKEFPKIAEKLLSEKSDDEAALTVTFADSPVEIHFDNNAITAKIRMSAIERGGAEYPGLRLVFQFQIENENGKIRLVVKEKPEAFPLGFDTERDQLSARETTIRAVVMKRLEKLAEKPIELNEIAIEGENGEVTLAPIHLSAKDGWLNVGLKVSAKFCRGDACRRPIGTTRDKVKSAK
jgi:hypothetical protein